MKLAYLFLDASYRKVHVFGALKCYAPIVIGVQSQFTDIRRKSELRDIETGIGVREVTGKKSHKAYIPEYKQIIDVFFKNRLLSFQAVTVDRAIVKQDAYNKDRHEVYLDYYVRSIRPLLQSDYQYVVYFDHHTMMTRKWLNKVMDTINRDYLYSDPIYSVESLSSKLSDYLQLVDLLTWAVNCQINQEATAEYKIELKNYVYQQARWNGSVRRKYKFNITGINKLYISTTKVA